ncbi:radical SAM protein [bacterium]|nr:radical SAM protein [bacterium]
MNTQKLSRLWNTALSLTDKLAGRDRVWANPLRIHLEVNDFCNLKCPHCPRENPDIPINTGHIPIEAIRNLEPWFKRTTYVGLAGNGEPFLHPDIIEILEIITRAGATPSVISNATLWKKRGMIDKIAGMGPMLMNVSIDGGTRETFEKWRKRANWDEVRENLRELRAAKEKVGSPFPVVTFITCLMKDTIGEVEQIVDLAAEAGAAVVTFQNMYPYNKLMDDARVRDLKACREAISKARRRAEPHGIRIDWFPMGESIEDRGSAGGSYGALSAETSDLEEEPAKQNGARPHYHCDNIWHQIHVDVRGRIKFCCFWTEGEIGDLTKDDFGTLWNGPEWRKLRADLHSGIKPKPCQDCHVLEIQNRRRILKAGLGELKDVWRQ